MKKKHTKNLVYLKKNVWLRKKKEEDKLTKTEIVWFGFKWKKEEERLTELLEIEYIE